MQSSHAHTLSRHDSVSRYKGIAIAIVLAALAAAVSLPILQGPFAQGRLAQTGADLATRQAHWADALQMRDPDWATTLFGMGLGRYPETHQWRSGESRAAAYSLGSEDENYYLRLGAGSPLYVEQFVETRPQKDYKLSLAVRSPRPGSRLSISLCEKWLLTSARCVFQAVEITAAGTWQSTHTTLQTNEVGDGPWYAGRPVKLSLYNANQDALVEVDNVRLQATDGQDLLINGDFSRGLDRWFFSADNDRPWHVWSLPIQVLFERGWLGVATLGLFGVVALLRVSRGAWEGDSVDAVVFAAIAGFSVVGSLDSLVDSPRILLLLLVLVTLAGNMLARIRRPILENSR